MPWLPSYVSPPPPHTLLSPNKPSPRFARSCRPCRSPCSGPVAVGLLLSFLKKSPLLCCISPVFLLFCKKSIESCLPPRNPPCCAFFTFVLSWAWAALSPTGKLPRIPPPLRDRRWGLWHGDSHPGATIQMALRPRCALLWGATPDIVGRRYHPIRGWYASESPWVFVTRGLDAPPATHRGDLGRPLASSLSTAS